MNNLLQSVINVARQAGQAILDVYHSEQLEIQTKADKTPVTQADLQSHAIISTALSKLEPNYPLLSEEGPALDYEVRQQWSRYWCVDPLDGTKEFIEKTGEFTVNIALIDQHQSIMGVIYCPVPDVLYYADEQGAYKQQQDQAPEALKCGGVHTPLAVALSKHHQAAPLKDFLNQLDAYQLKVAGSAFKFGLVAEGSADLYPRFGKTGEWDTAAGQCILEQAGGQVLDFDGRPLRYNTKPSLINSEFFAFGDEQLSKYVMMARDLVINKRS